MKCETINNYCTYPVFVFNLYLDETAVTLAWMEGVNERDDMISSLHE